MGRILCNVKGPLHRRPHRPSPTPRIAIFLPPQCNARARGVTPRKVLSRFGYARGMLNTRVAFFGEAVRERFEGHVTSSLECITYATSDSPRLVAEEALRDGRSRLLLLASDAAPSARFDHELPRLLHQASRAPWLRCISLGAEHYGPLLPLPYAGSRVRVCVRSRGRFALLLQNAGVRDAAAGGRAGGGGLLLATSPSIVHLTPSPRRNVLLRLPPLCLLLPPPSASHEKVLEALETTWQDVLRALLAYAVFALMADRIKRSLREITC